MYMRSICEVYDRDNIIIKSSIIHSTYNKIYIILDILLVDDMYILISHFKLILLIDSTPYYHVSFG